MGGDMNDLSPHPPRGRTPPMQRKPDWIRVKAPVSKGYQETRKLMRELNLHTVCEEAACPNIGECWTKKHATVMILGDVCTRALAGSATSRRACRCPSIRSNPKIRARCGGRWGWSIS